MKKKLLAVTLLGLLSASLLPGAAALAGEAPTVIRFGMATVGKGGVPYAPDNTSELAHQRQTIEEELKADGIKVEWHYFKGAGPAVNEALANKQLDFSMQGDLPAVVGKAGGLNTKLIAADRLLNSTYLVVPADSPARSLADLQGKKVSLFKGTNLHLVILRALKREGFRDRDFRLVNMDTATASAALASKDIDGGWFGPEAFQFQDKGIGRIIYDSRAVDASLTRQAHVLVDGDFEQKHPEIVQKVANGLVKAPAWAAADANREEALKLWANSGTPVEALRQVQAGQSFLRNYSPRIDAFFIERYRTTVKESKELGLIRNDVDVAQWVEPKYVERAIEQAGLQALWPVYDADNRVVSR